MLLYRLVFLAALLSACTDQPDLHTTVYLDVSTPDPHFYTCQLTRKCINEDVLGNWTVDTEFDLTANWYGTGLEVYNTTWDFLQAALHDRPTSMPFCDILQASADCKVDPL